MPGPSDLAGLGSTTPLVGREREQAVLREQLDMSLSGRGRLVLIGGEAGIGKTALAEWLLAEAAHQGALVLVGRCYDLSETPPYGPWRELFARAPRAAPLPALPAAVLPADSEGDTPGSQEAIGARVRAYLAAARPSLVLLLDDLHWADPASLDLLRAVARALGDLPLLLLVTYRSDELTRRHPLYALLPLLNREARATRLDLRPLDDAGVRALVRGRYTLAPGDETRLVAHLGARTEGNPFYAGELLRALEEEAALAQSDTGWRLGDLGRVGLPAAVRQVLDARVARLGEEAQRLLAIAAVLGQELLLDLWVSVAGTGEDDLLDMVERAIEARLLEATADGAGMRFAHALIREALYAQAPAMQRRAWHRRAGEALAELPDPDPDAVAYHLRQAGDPRAVEWLLRAGDRAERAYAWGIAADRCAAALAQLDRRGAPADERGWLGYRVAALRRYRDPRGALAMLEETARLAEETGDRALAACTLFLRGNLHCYAGEFGPGLAALGAGAAAIDALAGAERARLRALGTIGGFVPGARHQRGTLALRLAGAGRFAEARRVGEDLLGANPESAAIDTAGDLAEANAARGLAIARAALGHPAEARRAFARARATFQRLGDHFHVGMAAAQELQWVALPYRADRPGEIESLAAEAERAWARVGDAQADLPHGFARLPVLLIAGDWAAARALALAVHAAGGSYKAAAARALGVLAREQGDNPLAARLVREELPAGPDTLEGSANFSTALLLQCLAAAQALDAGKADEAREWLGAHDRWLAWSEAALGQAEGQLGWAAYHRVVGNLALARRHAERALAHATEPRQPLALLAAHRTLGELETAARRHADAAAHLAAALALAEACAAPYERALTLLALAELRLLGGARAAARALVEEARATCAPLGAAPALARVGALAARLVPVPPERPGYPAGLSAREAEVLRCVAAGESNREIAAALGLSVRTVEKHVAHVYAKLGARGRADAAAFAALHGLLPPSTDLP